MLVGRISVGRLKIVVRKELTVMYRKYCPNRISELDALIEQHGPDEVMKMTQEEFKDEKEFSKPKRMVYLRGTTSMIPVFYRRAE